MKVLQIFTVVSTIVFHSTSYAKTDPIVQKMMDAIKEKGLVLKEKRVLAPQCANFSGKWKGTCVQKDGQVIPDEMTIDQYRCEYVRLNYISYTIDGSISWSSSPRRDDSSPVGGETAVYWNDSQTKLKFLNSINVNNGSVVVVVASSQWLSGDQLRTKSEFATPIMTVDGPAEVDPISFDCTYDRVTGSH